MPQDRAATEVARHFFEKYGQVEAIAIISQRIQSDGAKQDTEFWLDVIRLIEKSAASVDASPAGMPQKLGSIQKSSTCN